MAEWLVARHRSGRICVEGCQNSASLPPLRGPMARRDWPARRRAPKHAERLSAGVTEVERAEPAHQPARKHGAAQANCCADAGVHCHRGPARVGPRRALRPCCAFRAGCGVGSIALDPVAGALSDAGWGNLSPHGRNTCYGKRKCTCATRLGSRRCDDCPQAGLLPAPI